LRRREAEEKENEIKKDEENKHA
jgi:hypothetical protein